MSLLLSIETSSGGCSTALHRDGAMLLARQTQEAHVASSQLGVMIKELLEEASLKPGELNGVVVSAGPGSYTGLRIGVATAKGLCYGLNIPLVSLNTLELMAHQVQDAGEKNNLQEIDLLCPMLDARRMEVYCMMLDTKMKIVKPTEALVIDSTSFAEMLSEKVVLFFGDGSQKCRGVLQSGNAKFLEGVEPLAAGMGAAGFQKFSLGLVENLAAFEPYYLKDFVAKKPKVLV